MVNAGPKRRYSRPERRRIIEEAALRVFAEHGYSETRIEDIAAAADVTKQLLYQHFSTKQELFLALLAKHRSELLGQLSADLMAPGSDGDRRAHALDRWLSYIEHNPEAAQLLFRDTTGEPGIQAVYRQMQADARNTLAASVGRDRPDLDPALVQPLAELLRAGAVGLALWWIEHPEVPRADVLSILLRTNAPRRGDGSHPAATPESSG